MQARVVAYSGQREGSDEEHLFVRGGRGGTRRTPFLIREGTRRVAKNIFLSAEDAEGRGEHPF